MDSLHPYMNMDLLHPYMDLDPVHILVYNTFSNFLGCPCFPRGPITSTTSHVALQTLGIIYGPLHSTLSHSANFKEILKKLHDVSEALSYLN